MTSELNELQENESLHNASTIAACSDAPLTKETSTSTPTTAHKEGTPPIYKSEPGSADSSDISPPMVESYLSPEVAEPLPSQDAGTDRQGNGHLRIASVEALSPATILMPKNVRSLPPKGSLAKALLDAGLRPDATVAASLIHPLVAYPSRDGANVQGFTNLELAALFRLQNIQTPVVVIQDTKVSRFLRSRSGTLLERLLHASNRAERLALAGQLMDVDIWSSLFDEELSEDLVATLIGVSGKTLTKYLKENKQESSSKEDAEGETQ